MDTKITNSFLQEGEEDSVENIERRSDERE